jgi:hypothetical protein
MKNRERNKSFVERLFELHGEGAGVSRDEIATKLDEHTDMINQRGPRKLAENGSAARASAIAAIRNEVPNLSIEDVEGVLRALWNFSSNPQSLGDLKDAQTA